MSGLVLVLIGTFLIWNGSDKRPQSAFGLAPDAQLPDFTLTTTSGTLSRGNLLGHWTLLFFGYTQCPDVCPSTLRLMKDIKAEVTRSGQAPPVVVFISVDPKRDTKELLDRYVHTFDPSFVAASGSDDELYGLVHNLGAFYQRNDTDGKPYYSVDHTANIYLVDTESRLVKVFAPPLDVMSIATSIEAEIASPTGRN